MKTIFALSRLLLIPCLLLFTVSCDLPGEEPIIDPNAEAEYRKPAVPVEKPVPPASYPGAPVPEPSPPVAKYPESIEDTLENGIEDILASRGPQIFDSLLGDGEDAEVVRSLLEHGPALIEEIMIRTNGGTEIPPEVIDEARHVISQNGPVVIDEMIRDTGAERPLARAIGELILHSILEAIDSGREHPRGHRH